MRRSIFNLLLTLALIFQGVVVVGADAFFADGAEQHCAGHDTSVETCVCCPEGGAMNAGCTVQCSAAHSSVAMILPVRIAEQSIYVSSEPLASDNPSYAPLIPPPIA
jgi:hypothetical protein